MQDFLGRDIEVGQVIVYPGRRGSNLWMNKAVVEETFPAIQCYPGEWTRNALSARRADTNTKVNIENPSRVVVVG